MFENLSSINLALIGVLFGFTGASVFSALYLAYTYVSRLRKQDDWLKELQSWQDQEDRKDNPSS